MLGIRIDDLPAGAAAAGYVIPAMKDGLSVKLTLDQVAEVMLSLGLIDADTAQTLTNKALTSPAISTPTISGNVLVTSTDAGQASGPDIITLRDSASPAANDVLSLYRWSGRDSAGNVEVYAQQFAQIVDPTSGTEDSRFGWQTVINGSIASRMSLGAGLYMDGATGGDPGAGKINAAEILDDGVRVPTINEVIGLGQTWQNMAGSRTAGTSYQNTTGRVIGVSITAIANGGGAQPALQVSADNVAWVSLDRGQDAVDYLHGKAEIPPGHYYRVQGSSTIVIWSELR
ncbi:MAG: hypothetical protein LCH86_07750 [Proteobacteria bacterium]|nr:hypothetical protein [Pseudomonadota bacterium]